jgi:hypothetical protein
LVMNTLVLYSLEYLAPASFFVDKNFD